MKHREILIGEYVGAVKVVDKVYNKDRKEWEYMCRCECGNVFKSRKEHLLKPRLGCKKCVSRKVALSNANRLDSPSWIGKRFGRLVVIDSYVKEQKTHWILRCDCGNVIDKRAGMVNAGQYKSCGCIAREIQANAISHDRLYSIWSGMKSRCFYEADDSYRLYGGRGITMCDEWKEDYKAFKDWAYKHGWTEDTPESFGERLSIERIDVNGNYEPANCCFIPLKQQVYNRRPSSEWKTTKRKTVKDLTILTINGETKTLREWQEFYNISNATLDYRKSKGMTLEQALTIPKDGNNVFEITKDGLKVDTKAFGSARNPIRKSKK